MCVCVCAVQCLKLHADAWTGYVAQLHLSTHRGSVLVWVWPWVWVRQCCALLFGVLPHDGICVQHCSRASACARVLCRVFDTRQHTLCVLGRHSLAGCSEPPGIYPLSSAPSTPVPRRFVQNLRQAAATQPTVTVRQGYVRRLVNGGWLGLVRPWDRSGDGRLGTCWLPLPGA